MSQFDPNAFLHAEVNEVSKKRNPLPVGEYSAILGEGKIVPWTGKKDPTKSGWRYDTPVTIEIPAEVQGASALAATVTQTYSIMLDVSSSGGLDMAPGKNGSLRRFREALDMNREGSPFSFAATFGRAVKVQITHELYEGEVQDRIAGLAKF